MTRNIQMQSDMLEQHGLTRSKRGLSKHGLINICTLACSFSRQVAYGVIDDGKTNTSPRAEGIYLLIKVYIKISTLDLFDAW